MILPGKTVSKFISTEILQNSKVLDLGCGDGTLLKHLIEEKNIIGHGIDINTDEIIKCIEKGIPVIHWNLDNLPLDFPDNSYDTVILTQTLQQVYHPEVLIKEIIRVGKDAILSFPNFASTSIRWEFVRTGKMPITKELPNKWYNTPNIKLFTIKDFLDFCQDNDIEIIKQHYLRHTKHGYHLVRLMPNLFADVAIFKIKKKNTL